MSLLAPLQGLFYFFVPFALCLGPVIIQTLTNKSQLPLPQNLASTTPVCPSRSKAGRQWDAAPLPPPTHRPSPPKNPEKDEELRRATCRSLPDLEHFGSRFPDFTPKRGNPGAPLPHCPQLCSPQTLCTSLGASRRFGDSGTRLNNAESVFISPDEAPEFGGGDPEARDTSGPRSQVSAPGWPHFPPSQPGSAQEARACPAG